MPQSSVFLSHEATQLRSKTMSEVEQGGLLLSRAQPADVPLPLVTQRKTFLAAINLCIDLSGLEDKEIYLPLGIDAGHFSNLRKGRGHFPPDRINDLMDLCGNEVPLIWLAHSRGKGLVVLQSESERIAAELAAQLAEANRENALLRNLLQGKAA